jgi:hypothetical protein
MNIGLTNLLSLLVFSSLLSQNCQTYNTNNPFNPVFSGASTINCGSNTTIICSEINSRWYSQPVGGNAISVNNQLSVTPLVSTTYYVQREIPINQTVNFNYTGSQQSWTVPNGVNSISVILSGARGAPGGGVTNNGIAGKGGTISAVLSVTPGQILYIYVGGMPSCTNCGGWNGGGLGSNNSGGGGGASDIRIGGNNLNNRVIVAGGGGGGGCYCYCCGFGNGGDGGGNVGGDANYPFGSMYNNNLGHGGTQSNGGLGGSGIIVSANGILGQGGSGYSYGAGGGSGYYGGGGGLYDMGGGGGSSYASNIASNVAHVQGDNSSNGFVSITYSEICNSNRVTKLITVNSISSPPTPTSNSPQCGPVTITRNGNPPAGETWYWQGTNPNGTATNLGSGPTYTANSSGTYYLRALNSSGCWSAQSASINVLIDAIPATPGVLSSNSPQCNSVTITRSGNPAAGITWYWQGTNANGTATNLGSGINYTCSSSGTYYLRAINSSGCWSASSSSVSVVVNQLPSQPSNPVSNSPQCNAVVLTRLGNPPAGETWYWQGTNANGTSTVIGSGVNFTASSSGTYYLRSMTSANCWSNSSSSTSVVVYSLPNVPATPFSNSPQCASVTVSRSGNPPAGTTWYWQGTNPNGTLTNLGAAPTYTANASGTYFIRALNNDNCWSSNSASTAVTVFTTNTGVQSVVACDSFTWVNGVTYTNSTNSPSLLLPNASVFGCDSNLVLNLTVYPSFSTTDAAVSCDNFTWIDGITYSASTNIPSYMLTSQYGCDSLVNLNLTIGYSTGDTTSIGATSIGSYFLNGIEYTESGVYNQTLMDQYGCDSVVTLNLIVETSGLNTLNLGLHIFPNPSVDGSFYVKSSSPLSHVTILNSIGQAVNFTIQNDIIQLESPVSGMYFIQVSNEEKQSIVIKGNVNLSH